MKTLKAQVIISLITCFFLVLAVTICKGNKFGNILSESENTTESQTGTSGILRHTDDGVQIISTRQLTKDINGYGGNVPLEIYIKENRILKVVALENSETPSYFAKVRNSGLLQQWSNLHQRKQSIKKWMEYPEPQNLPQPLSSLYIRPWSMQRSIRQTNRQVLSVSTGYSSWDYWQASHYVP